MQVVLPELDGRLLTAAISFKAAEDGGGEAAGLARTINRPDADGVALAADRAAGWARLGIAPAQDRRIAIVLSDYPGIGGQQAHAVGLDSFASLRAILHRLHCTDYRVEPPGDETSLAGRAVPCRTGAVPVARRVCPAAPYPARHPERRARQHLGRARPGPCLLGG